jgi:hypothetical protein
MVNCQAQQKCDVSVAAKTFEAHHDTKLHEWGFDPEKGQKRQRKVWCDQLSLPFSDGTE